MTRYIQYGSVLLLAFAIAALVATLLDSNNLFVQVDYTIEIVQTVHNGTTIQPLSDLLDTIRTMAIVEPRARLLPYYLIALDQKLRLALYAFGPIPPSFNPIRWLLDGIIAPILFFGFLRIMTKSATAACVGLAIYMTSSSFLNIFTMNWVPTKALLNFILIVALWVCARIDQKLQANELMFEGSRRSNFTLLLLILAGFLCDEYGFFGPALIVLMFWWRFLPLPFERQVVIRILKNLAWLLYPIGAFLLIMLIVIPLISRHVFGLRFDYVGGSLSSGFQFLLIKLFGNGYTTVNWDVVFGPIFNLINFFAISLLPFSLTELAPQFPIHLGIQKLGWFHVLAFSALTILFILTVRSELGDKYKTAFYRLLLPLISTAVLMLLISALAIANGPRNPNGFYYGAPVAIPFSIFVAYLVRYSNGALKIVTLAACFWIGAVQYRNFIELNSTWASTFDIFNSRSLSKFLPFRPPEHDVKDRGYEQDFKESSFGTLPGPNARFPTWDVKTYDEMREILQAASNGRLDEYLDRRALAPRLFYLIPEQCALDPTVSKRCGPLVSALQRQLTQP